MTSIFWFRRDLRLEDNHGLFQALQQSDSVYPVFIFDSTILEKLPSKHDRRVHLIWDAVEEINQQLSETGKKLHFFYGNPVDIIPKLASEWKVNAVFANSDYEPNAINRDNSVQRKLADSNREFHTFKDHVIFEMKEIMKSDGSPYVVYTPYSKAWMLSFKPKLSEPFSAQKYWEKFSVANKIQEKIKQIEKFEDTGFKKTDVKISGTRKSALNFLNDFSNRIQNYGELRDIPSKKGVSYLSPYLRFGQISIRECVLEAIKHKNEGSEKWFKELIWREFYSMILYNFPDSVHESFKPEYRNLNFPNDEKKFHAWCEGKTGFPIIDAAMRQLNQTGWMHNRLRMISASFLVKDLHIDWRWGEKYFADLLIDFDLSSNNGGWQWAASTGCDAQPYFRIFNPELQSKKFDPDGVFIKKFVPELSSVPADLIHTPEKLSDFDQISYKVNIGKDYPLPVVNHQEAKAFALSLFKHVP